MEFYSIILVVGVIIKRSLRMDVDWEKAEEQPTMQLGVGELKSSSLGLLAVKGRKGKCERREMLERMKEKLIFQEEAGTSSCKI